MANVDPAGIVSFSATLPVTGTPMTVAIASSRASGPTTRLTVAVPQAGGGSGVHAV